MVHRAAELAPSIAAEAAEALLATVFAVVTAHGRVIAMKKPPSPILAAGAVVWRYSGPASSTSPPGGGSDLEICLVHRPRYDDWSLPKGKVDRGEHILTCAVREVEEETGHRVTLGRPLPPQRYEADGSPKKVRYWLAEADPRDPRREPDSEVDDVAFLPVAAAMSRLTHLRDADLLAAALTGPMRTNALVFLRHTAAVARSSWTAPDAIRPLEPRGRVAAARLAAPLATLGLSRVVCSNAIRCIETVRPFAEKGGPPPEIEPLISEEGAAVAHHGELATFVQTLLRDGAALVCSHRPVLPQLIAAAGADPGEPLPPGGFAVVHHNDGHVVATDRYP